jgi:hypothetical protein
VAQLGARLDGIEEVVGSNPIGSTMAPSIAVPSRCSLARLFVTVPREDSTWSTFSYSWKSAPPRDNTRVIKEECGSDSPCYSDLRKPTVRVADSASPPRLR